MTNKEAKEIIKSECYVFNSLNFDRTTKVNTALDVAIEALEKQDRITQILDNYNLLDTWEILDRYMGRRGDEKMTKEENPVEIGVDIGDKDECVPLPKDMEGAE